MSSLELPAVELPKWPNSKKRDKAAELVADAHVGTAHLDAAKKAFEIAAKEAGVSTLYRGP